MSQHDQRTPTACPCRFTLLTYRALSSFILRKEEAPVCVACHAVIKVTHILIDCEVFVGD